MLWSNPSFTNRNHIRLALHTQNQGFQFAKFNGFTIDLVLRAKEVKVFFKLLLKERFLLKERLIIKRSYSQYVL